METGDDNYFSSPDEVCNSMPYELLYTRSSIFGPSSWWVFRSRQGNELQSILRSLCPGSSTSTSRNEAIKEKIEVLFQNLILAFGFFFSNNLIQFWSPVRIADKICLTTADQPFAVGRLQKGLFSYRKLCLENSILINPADGDELSGEQHYLSPPEWVFRHGLPEYFDFGDKSNSLVTEYLQLDFAQLGLNSYVVFPLFEYGKQDCIGVLEILSEMIIPYLECRGDIYSSVLKKMNMRFGIESNCDGNIRAYGNRFEYSRNLVAYALPIMQDIFDKHQLPLAQMWFASPDGSCMRKFLRISKQNIDGELDAVRFGRDTVIRKAFLFRCACFSKKICHSRQYGCFAVCLQSTKGDQFYILEFVFPYRRRDVRDPRTFVTKLVEDLKIKIGESESSPFQYLDKTYVVHLVKISSDLDKLDSFEICSTSSPHLVSKHPEGSKMMRHDSLHPQVGETHGEVPIEPNTLINEENIVTGVQSARIRAEENTLDVQYGITLEVLQQHQLLPQVGETHGEVPIEPNTLINEENIVTGVQSAKTRAEENTLDVLYGITPEVLQQHQGMKLQDAADKLGVSRSTLKRLCRKYDIKRWHQKRPRKTSRQEDAFSPPNENTDAHSRPMTTVTQDGSSITVKATYEECIWKFRLLLSARKIDLEQQLVERLNLPMGSFKIQYLDEENDLISVSCDSDLKLCIDTCRSQGKTTIKMSVN